MNTITALTETEAESKLHLFVDLVGVAQLAIGGAVQRRDSHGLHGDKLDFVGEPLAGICTPRHPVNVLEDGGRGQLLACAAQWRRT